MRRDRGATGGGRASAPPPPVSLSAGRGPRTARHRAGGQTSEDGSSREDAARSAWATRSSATTRSASASRGALAERLGPRPDLDVVEECSVGGLNLVEVFAGYDRVVVLDSIMTGGGTPGHLVRLRRLLSARDAQPAQRARPQLRHGARARSRHGDARCPRTSEIRVFAVEVADTATFSETMTRGARGCPPGARGGDRRRGRGAAPRLSESRPRRRAAGAGGCAARPRRPRRLVSSPDTPGPPPCRAPRRAASSSASRRRPR